ncbi:uncharacterized protein LOC130719213 [Lotus japonicus]|uniref:uncharacterized protein LOC130719213 n=1 Tax=Lotus japonicus TaxID=34305 RepID=UPI0025875F27|nr:uncharacterized protein LOC130719213 [Lotus japonicus]
MDTESNTFWCRLLRAKYENGISMRKSSNWWKDLHLLCFGSREGKWYEEGAHRKVGDGGDINFWYEKWIGDASLCCLFRPLYQVSAQQNHKVKDMGVWSAAGWSWNFCWVSPLNMEQERLLVDLQQLICNFVPKLGCPDSWKWVPDQFGIYSVKSAYMLLSGSVPVQGDNMFRLLWSLKAPSNAIALAWKVLINRIQTKVNLNRRGIVLNSACPLCSTSDESTDHLFFSCPIVWKVWSKISAWFSVFSVLPADSSGHFLQHLGILGSLKIRKGVGLCSLLL